MKYILTYESFNSSDEDELRSYATFYSDQYQEGEDEYADPNELSWKLDKKYPVSNFIDTIMSEEEWVNWFDDEVNNIGDATGNPNHYDDLLIGNIHTEVVLVELNGNIYIWDGYHRIGSSIKVGRKTIPAIIGFKK